MRFPPTCEAYGRETLHGHTNVARVGPGNNGLMGQNAAVGHTGKRAAPRRKRSFQPALLLLALGVTLCVVAWGYLVKAAIDFGATAREGTTEAWWFLALASVGAVACLFVGLMLVARITRRLGITKPSTGTSSSSLISADDEGAPPVPVAPRIPGGRRAAR